VVGHVQPLLRDYEKLFLDGIKAEFVEGPEAVLGVTGSEALATTCRG
jgi:hypothetical protein